MILVVVAGVAVYFLRRREKDEIHTINHYRDALTTLDDMRAPSGRTVKILSADEARELRQPHPGAVIRSEPPRSPRLSPPPGADRDLVFDDNGEPIEYPVAQTRSHFHHDDPEWAISRMSNRHVLHNRELVAAAGAIAVLIVLAVIGIFLGSSSGSSSKNKAQAPVTTTTTKTHHAPTTTTTLPAALTAQPGATANAATYDVPSSRFAAVISASSSGACWTVVTSSSGGSLFAGSIAAGSSQSVQGSSGFTITLGAPGNASITLNGVPVTFPSGYGAPLTLTFVTPVPTTTTTTNSPVATTTTQGLTGATP